MCFCKYEPNMYVHSVRIYAYIRVIVKKMRIAYIFFLFFAYAATQLKNVLQKNELLKSLINSIFFPTAKCRHVYDSGLKSFNSK